MSRLLDEARKIEEQGGVTANESGEIGTTPTAPTNLENVLAYAAWKRRSR